MLAWLSEIRDVLAHTGRTVIFVGVDFEIPPVLQPRHHYYRVQAAERRGDRKSNSLRRLKTTRSMRPSMSALVTACRGMTQQQVEDRTALALRKFKKLNGQAARLILNEKAEVIRRTGLLEYRDPPAKAVWT